MIIYTEKYTESESDIQNNNLLYKIHQQHQNTFDKLVVFVVLKRKNEHVQHIQNFI